MISGMFGRATVGQSETDIAPRGLMTDADMTQARQTTGASTFAMPGQWRSKLRPASMATTASCH